MTDSGDLNATEMNILRLAADGLRYPEIAQELKLSGDYIKKAAHKLLDKLGADNITQAVAMGFRRKILT